MEDQSVAYHLYVGINAAAETFVAAWLTLDGQPTAPSTGEQTAASVAAPGGLPRDAAAAGRATGCWRCAPRDTTSATPCCNGRLWWTACASTSSVYPSRRQFLTVRAAKCQDLVSD